MLPVKFEGVEYMRGLFGTGRWAEKGFPLYILPLFFALLFLAGGASRADVFGQVIVRAAAWAVILALLVGNRTKIQLAGSGVPAIIAATAGIALIQIIPLPPTWWQALPGRSLFADAALVAGQSQPWRPISISPSLTFNALGSLIVAAATMLLFYASGKRALRLSLIMLAVATLLAALWGALQFSGASLGNPFVNDVPGMVSGPFANRNHLALFLAIGCVVWPVSAAYLRVKAVWWIGAYIVNVFFLMAIGATGSRAGLALAVVGCTMAIGITRGNVVKALSHFPTRFKVGLGALFIATIIFLIVLSLQLGRAAGLERLVSLDSVEDLRFRALPTVWAMTVSYFPAGIGFGAFDPAFRIWEPTELLQLPYFNHAHNDLVETVLEGGLLSIIVGGFAFIWAVRAYMRALRLHTVEDRVLAQAGAAILLMVVMASVVDYPGRTPLIMATIVIAALWLEGAVSSSNTARTTNAGA